MGVRMTVKELITELEKIQDKNRVVYLDDWNEDYADPAVLTIICGY